MQASKMHVAACQFTQNLRHRAMAPKFLLLVRSTCMVQVRPAVHGHRHARLARQPHRKGIT